MPVALSVPGISGELGGGSLQVVETRIVSGYEVAVLKASSAFDLTNWLKFNGFQTPRFATRWAVPYVKRGWYFAAFKVVAGKGAGSTGPVKMSFRTSVPFNPYSVPAENKATGGLSLFYISATREEAKIGGKQTWRTPQWAAPLDEETSTILSKGLNFKDGEIPKISTVRYYRDDSFGQSGFDDIYFVPADENSQRSLELYLVGLGLGTLGFVRIGRSSAG